MDDTPCCRFFQEPSCAPQRQYEALRAVFIDRCRQKDVAERFGYDYAAFRQLRGAVPCQLRRRPAAPLFSAPRPGPPPGPRAPAAARPERPAMADCRALGLAPGRRLRTRVAGLFLFLPLLARLHFDDIVRQASYPGSRMIPGPAALLSLLALKLLDKERRSHIDDFNCDEALGLFAGLNVLPKKSFMTDYSYRTTPPAAAVAAGRLGRAPWRRCCSPRPRPSPWTSTRSRIAATRPAWSATTSPARARRHRAC